MRAIYCLALVTGGTAGHILTQLNGDPATAALTYGLIAPLAGVLSGLALGHVLFRRRRAR